MANQKINFPDFYRIISRTDLQGNIIEANQEFIEVSGYTREELIGQPHNILRHPDVPKEAFKDLWQTLKAGKPWVQIVKNLAKSGDYYWVKASVSALKENGNIVGYISIRVAASDAEIEATSVAYKQISAGKLVIREGKVFSPLASKLFKINPFNYLAIMPKMLVSASLLIIIATIISVATSYNAYQANKQVNKQEIIANLDLNINTFITNSGLANLNLALAMSVHATLNQALSNNDRTLARAELDKQILSMENITGIKPRIHFHTNYGHSFLRSWNTKNSDDLTSFRSGVNQLIRNNEALHGVELGRAGIAIRAISPVFKPQTKDYIGSVEVLIGINSLIEHFTALEVDYIALLTEQSLNIATRAATNRKFGNLTLANPTAFSETAIEALAGVDMTGLSQLSHDGFVLTADHFIIQLPIIDITDQLVGYHVFIKDAQYLRDMNQALLSSAQMEVIKLILFLIAVVLLMLFLIRRIIVIPIKEITKFIQKAIKTGDLSSRANSLVKDEIGAMAQAYNQQMQDTQIVFGEAGRVIGEVSRGNFAAKIDMSMPGDFRVLKYSLNASSTSIKEAFSEISDLLASIGRGQFDISTVTSAQGEFLVIINDAHKTIAVLKEIFAEVNLAMAQVARGFFEQRIKSASQGEFKQLANNINQSLENLEAAISSVAEVMFSQEQGDLTSRVDIDLEGSLGTLKASVNNSATKLSELLSLSNQSIKALAASSLDISQDISDLSTRTQQQAASVEETAASMEEITSTIQQTAQNANEVNKLATTSKQEAQTANNVVQQTIVSINEISQASRKIAEITTLIDSIAFQTNLLALNAAVEAARAGEHGRGFAVVAGEVRSLAGKSAEAAKEIRVLIDDTVTKINEGAGLAEQSGQALVSINDSITKVVTRVSEISQTTAEQAKGVEQVNHAITSIDATTQQNALLVDETYQRTIEMQKEASNASEVIQQFKIDD